MSNYAAQELIDFAKNAKFKTAKSTLYTYFNPNSTSQIRIHKKDKYSTVNVINVTIHQISEDNITFSDYEYRACALSLKEAKIEAAKHYFNELRKGV